MRLIDADELITRRVENDPVVIAAKCALTAYNADKVVEQLDNYYKEEDEKGCYIPDRIQMNIENIVKAGGVNE